jgi:pyruvate dehydrogenase E2 component (dihydrolipoamide acetyltransferase)
MPRLSDSMEEGTILRWLKAEGEEVAVGDELAEIETDKANMVYESDASGTLTRIVAGEGETLPIGEVIALIGEGSTPPPAGETTPRSPEGSNASPVARRIARAEALDLSGISGSGPRGRIVKRDVEAALASRAARESLASSSPSSPPKLGGPPASLSPPAPAGPTDGTGARPETAKGKAKTVDLSKPQHTVARRMAESKATAPHFYLETVIDMTSAVDARAAIKAATEGDVVPSFNDIVIKACATALREFPRVNGAYRDGQVEEYPRINIGVAVAGRETLVVPTVFDADRKGLRQIATETRALASRVREESITPPELSGGTFTVSNLGMFGVTSFAAVINPPQAAILAVGSIEETPVVRDGEIAIGHRMAVNLGCDHRILYGADGARFLGRVRELLEEPSGLAL